MKANAAASNASHKIKQSQFHESKFNQVKDGRKQPVRGLLGSTGVIMPGGAWKAMAERVNIGPSVVPLPQAATV